MPKGRTASGEAMRARILDAVGAREHAPSIHELAQELGVTDNTIRHHVRELVRSNLMSSKPHTHRSLSLSESGMKQRATNGGSDHGQA